jgi:hypothetical protein
MIVYYLNTDSKLQILTVETIISMTRASSMGLSIIQSRILLVTGHGWLALEIIRVTTGTINAEQHSSLPDTS